MGVNTVVFMGFFNFDSSALPSGWEFLLRHDTGFIDVTFGGAVPYGGNSSTTYHKMSNGNDFILFERIGDAIQN